MTVERGTVSLAVEEAGAGSPVVMLMGAGSPGRVWQAYQVPALVPDGYRVLLPDLRGVGGSAGADASGLAELADDVVAVIEDRVGGPAALVGTSLGARVAWEVALRRPDLVTGLCLLAVQMRAAAVSTVHAMAQIDLGTGPDRPSRSARAALGAAGLSPESLADDRDAEDWFDMLDMAPWPMPDGAVAQFRVAMADFPAGAPRCPTTVVAFADDAVCPPRLCREVADAIGRARFRTVAAAGHLGYLERPDDVNALILDFLRDLSTDEPNTDDRGGRP
ncbi:alpha/beta fold hydrolase [Pseudonocardia endophytica]|uniref:Pimeloyl-ACP methyl ester carboxylesterase n=1 Tax=Pseudonocardia endophytica TaxID=401976 RepID=A0A4R1HR19_PSEEN|nr:alpha/beta hydrolase [Pseudonocardia endophytica]TCK24588.1 pimeloyl-ACP methyl ester carboxylesterase [Pseudonocardia endophytica]